MERQCLLKNGTIMRVAWIDEKDAVVGKVISDRNSPEYGWTVKSVGASRPRLGPPHRPTPRPNTP
jgi:hypothetical protein